MRQRRSRRRTATAQTRRTERVQGVAAHTRHRLRRTRLGAERTRMAPRAEGARTPPIAERKTPPTRTLRREVSLRDNRRKTAGARAARVDQPMAADKKKVEESHKDK